MTLQRHGEADDAFASAFRRVQSSAERYALRCGIEDFAGDLAQEALARLLERQRAEGRALLPEEMDLLVRRLADAERHARDAERKHLSLLRTDGRGPDPSPEPCPRLVELAPAHPRPRALRTRLAVAAHSIARHPRVLVHEQYRIFDWVWAAGATVATAAELLGVSEGAARKRLDRVSEHIERCILRDLEEAMLAHRWDELSGFLGADGRRLPSRCLAEATFLGLARVIHNRSLRPGMGQDG